MNYSNLTRVNPCYNPKVIKNRYTGEVTSVRCGKCPACKDAKAAEWVQRLDVEAACHKYNWFATLQYSDQFVPQMIRVRKEDCSDDIMYIDGETGLYISLSDVHPTQKDIKYCYDTKVLNVLRPKDIQDFIKRLRYEFRKIDGEAQLRYFCALEMGPTTFRPHSHILLFFDSDAVAQVCNELLCKTWQYGCCFQPHQVSGGSAASYVASYVNSFTNLPRIYLHKEIRPRALFSTCPPLGTLEYGFEEVRKIFFSGANELTLYQKASNTFRNVPLWRSLRDRCFPRIPYFNSLSHSNRVALYRLAQRRDYESAEDFAKELENDFVRSDKRKDFICQYLRIIAFNGGKLYLDKLNTLQFDLDFKIERGNDYGFYMDNKMFNFSSLLRFCRIISRVSVQAESYHISIAEYVSYIEKFYDSFEKSRLSDYFRFQNEYFKEHDVREHLCFDFHFCESVNGKHVDDLQEWQIFYLKQHCIIDDSTDIVHLDFKECFDYQNMRSLHDKIHSDSTKTKSANDYLISRADKFQNVINYFNDLDSNYE